MTEHALPVQAYIGLGGNLGDPVANMQAALAQLSQTPQITNVRCSPFYRSAPVGYLDQPDFINAVAQLSTTLSARALLDALLATEHALGRERTFANAPRTLDLDLLLYGDIQLDHPALTVPHPRLHLRAFVLRPLADLSPTLHVPGKGPLADWLAACQDQDIAQLR